MSSQRRIGRSEESDCMEHFSFSPVTSRARRISAQQVSSQSGNMQPDLHAQSGRTLLEQLAVLAIVAVLVITALAGFTYARNKVMANRILSDVSLAYMDASEQERAVGIYPILFAPESGLFIETERQETASGKRTDLVRVDGVRSSVCKIVHQMTQDSSFVLLDWSEEAQDYVEFTSCSDGDNTMVFAYGKDIGCTCPEHGTCYLSQGCVCDFGYVKTENGNCEEIICPVVKEVEDITDEYCCVTANGEWNGICYCPEDYYFNGTSCVPGQGFCVYAYEPPSGNGYYADCAYTYEDPIGNGYYADCAYTYQEPIGGGYYAECSYTFSETVSADNERTASLTAGMTCPSGQYCILRWTDTDCGSALPAEGAPTLYGRCATLSTSYSQCRQRDENATPTLTQTESCPSGQYCILRWTDTDCGSTIPAEGAPTIYGRCATLSTSYNQCRQRDENATPTLTQTESCPSGQYCILRWTDTDCGSTIPAEGAPTIYGRCATLSTSYSQCRQYEENIVPSVWARRSCDDNQYCRLNWSSDTCNTLPAEGADLLYGVCLALNKTSPLVCPVEIKDAQ